MTAVAQGRHAADLDSIVLLLRTAQLVADRKLAGADPALRMALADRLRLARRAVADLQLSGRGGKDASRGAASRPVQLRAGRPPASGTGSFALPEASGLPSFEIGVGPLYDALLNR